MLDVHRLRVLRSVVVSGSVSAAASNLGYTPSAISQHLTALQRETGLVLLERFGRGLRPTPAGLAVAAEAAGVLARIGEAETAIAGLRSDRTAHLSLAYFASVGNTWLPTVVHRLAQEHPELSLDLRLLEYSADDGQERPDIQLTVGDKGSLQSRPGFSVHHLADDPYHVVLPVSHTLADRQEIELGELATDRWIDNEAPAGWCRRALLEACAAAGVSPAFHVQAHDYTMAIAFVGGGLGITVLPALAARNLPEGLRSVPVVRPTPSRTIFAVVRKSVAETAPVLVVLEALSSIVAVEPSA